VQPILIRSSIVAAAMAIAWVFAGRQISLLFDRIMTIPLESLPVTPLAFDGGSLWIGERIFALEASIIEFAPEPGDEVSFNIDRSFLSWPTPFETNFMTGHTSSWRRHRYYRLVCKKRSGARLEMVWRYEQWFYPSLGGWTASDITHEGSTGLIHVSLRPETSNNENVVAKYITRTKGWKRTEYRIESRGLSPDARCSAFAVIYLDDERGASPGAGRSVELYVDRASHQVIQELGGQ
jgi:hypothetical protein